MGEGSCRGQRLLGCFHGCTENISCRMNEHRSQSGQTPWRVKGTRCGADTDNDAHSKEIGEVAVAARQSACDLIGAKIPGCRDKHGAVT